ncbi:membrane protein insertase YidC [Actinoplanes sp. N902-109]|uniref:membrane protein insertase YidC n=1 Tax=Actinoplanes sp. (strain N902-109) TaxID=649831 RepID=UPI0003296309|nr:membrane protein insertase YidC [Actinoplanes sp. N902-109]AGL17079.1 60 kDa inner membrane insertion protein [Actinoplanes sp. N902-109]
MSLIYTAISAVLLLWHGAWRTTLGDLSALATDWSWVLGIIFLVLTVRALLFPVFVRQVRSQRAMQRLQPQLKALQAKHKGNPQALQKDLTELYRTEQVNPLSGILPMLVQIPIFIGLLHVLRHLKPTITDHASRTLYGWTAAQFDDAAHAKLFGAPIAATFHSGAAQLEALGAHGLTVKIVAAVLIAAMIVTTYLTSRMSMLRSGWSEDPQQRMVQRLMLYGIPASLLISGTVFPIGVVLYWTTQNLFALGQQAWILRRYPLPDATGAQPASITP